MSEPIKAIETRYAGCRFRSRLEARWAVFFDHLGIEWQYEPQGFDIAGTRYLPDFYLPGHGLWVEVKGTDDGLNVPLLVRAAIPDEGLPANPEGARMEDPSRAGFRLLILGPITRVAGKPLKFDDIEVLADIPTHWVQPTHIALHFWKGDITIGYCLFSGRNALDLIPGDFVLGNDCGDVFRLEDGQYPTLTNGGVALQQSPLADVVVDACTAARSARFEHGEQG